MVDLVKTWLRSHSQGQLVFSEDSGIVLPPHESLEDGVAPAWIADLTARDYADMIETPNPAYDAIWSPFVGEWWNGGSGITRLYAEILYKIYDAYEDADPPVPWPFGNADTDPELVDYLFFVFQTAQPESPFDNTGDIGGTPGIKVNAAAVQSGVTAAFFGNLDVHSNVFRGTGQVQNPVDGDYSWDFKILNAAYALLHEYGHTLGFYEGPPHLGGIQADEIWRYYYGNLNVMCQHYPPNDGIPIIGLHYLATTGWVPVIDFTGENLFNQKIWDIRHTDAEGGAGAIYKFRLENPAGEPQHFLMAYHSGYGIDDQDGANVVPGRGLEIVHVVGDDPLRPKIVDIESAFGMYQFIQTNTLPPFVIPPPPESGWGVPNAAWGFDNYDLWWVDNDETDLRLLREDGVYIEYSLYTGDPYDFFRLDPISDGGDSWSAPDFSWNTNPNANWYFETGEYSGVFYRFNHQNVTNSLIVHIREQHDDEHYMMVDFLSAPGEEITYPPALPTVTFAPGEVVTVTWTGNYDEVIDGVDVYFSRLGGAGWDLVALNEPAGALQHSYDWTPTEADETTDGRLKLVYHNSLSHHTQAVVSALFAVGSTMIAAEEVLFPGDGDEVFSGQPMEIRWTDYFSDYPGGVTIEQVDVERWDETLGEDGDWANIETDVAYQTVYDELGSLYNWWEWTPELALASGQARLRLVFHASDQSVNYDESDGSFAIIPVPFALQDRTEEVRLAPEGVDQQGWEGLPYSAIPLDYDGDGDQDLFVAVYSSEDQQGTSVLFRNDLQGPLPSFARDPTAFPAAIFPPQGALGLSAGDFDSDGDEDLFLAYGRGASRLYRAEVGSGGQFENYVNVAGDEAYFTTAAADLLDSVCAPIWIDFDHDGDLDLFLGRGVFAVEQLDGGVAPTQTFGFLSDVLFRNDLGSGETVFEAVEGGDGLVPPTASGASVAVAWCDLNLDGLWEVFVGDASPNGIGSRLFHELPTGGFAVAQTDFGVPLAEVVSAQWTDADHDGLCDLVVCQLHGTTHVLYGEDGGPGNGRLSLTRASEISLPAQFVASAAVASDANLDGWPDIWVANWSGEEGPESYLNVGHWPSFTASFVRLTEVVSSALDDGETLAVSLSDFNGDGDVDLFSGRNVASGRFFQTIQPDEGATDPPADTWFGVQPRPNQASGNAAEIVLGATVLVRRGGELLGAQVVDGGSGRGGQQARVLKFPRHGTSDQVEVEVYWPRRSASSIEYLSPQASTVYPVYEPDEFAIDPYSIKFSQTFDPSTGEVVWIFRWITDNWTKQQYDRVRVTSASGVCGLSVPLVLQQGGPGVVVEAPRHQLDLATGDVVYLHELRFHGWECAPNCVAGYEVASGITAPCTPVAAPVQIKVKVCPKAQP